MKCDIVVVTQKNSMIHLCLMTIRSLPLARIVPSDCHAMRTIRRVFGNR